MDTEFDREHLWHQYSSLTKPIKTYPVVKAEGARVYLEDGRVLVDGLSSWWCAIQGYNHPELNQAAEQQLHQFSHFMFAGVSHKPAIDLGKKLLAVTPPALDNIFYAETGSTSVEVALKLSHLYWAAKNNPKRQFLALSYSYHGDTFGAMSVCDPINSMHKNYNGYFTNNFFVEAPKSRFGGEWDPQDEINLQEIFKKNHRTIAAVIVEPIVQNAGGLRIYHPEYLRAIRRLCDKYHTILILDEVATGFGRTGKLFAFEHAGIVPDILCLGKGLTSGYVPLSPVLMTRDIANTVSDGPSKRFMHGPTYMANALACAIASKNMDVLATGNWKIQVDYIEATFKTDLFDKVRDLALVGDCRGIGSLAVVELTKLFEVSWIQEQFVNEGVFIRPNGRLVYLLPPYVITQEELHKLCSAVVKVIKKLDSM